MQTNTNFKISTEQLEVIGRGGMITEACQVGEWWVTPLWDYKGQIPADIQEKKRAFLKNHPDVIGLLVADDIREVKHEQKVETKQEPEKPKEKGGEWGKALTTLFASMMIVGAAMMWIVAAALSYDPMLIAVMDDGRWVCLGAWYD